MRLLLISLAALLLAAGCAGSRPGDPAIAPSRQAALADSNSGWSVPPGQHSATDPAQSPADTAQAPADEAQVAPAATQPDEAAVAEAERVQREEAARKAREELQSQREPTRSTPPQPMVKPLVPAFPARAAEERVVTLRTVHFAFDQWDLTPEAKALLDENARWLKANPDVEVRVAGHADERGTPEYNLALGERRAKRVREYLIEQGVPADNLLTISYGEEMPLDPAHTSAAWSRNRRAEFHKAEGRQVSSADRRKTSG